MQKVEQLLDGLEQLLDAHRERTLRRVEERRAAVDERRVVVEHVALRLDMLIIDIAEPGRGLGLGLGGATLDMSDSPSVSVPPSDIIPAPPSTSAYIRGFTASYVMY